MTGVSASAALARLVRDAIRAALFDVHTAFPARVEAVNRDDTGWIVDVQPQAYRFLAKRGGGEAREQLPVIPSVPVVWPSAGGWGIAMPIEVGDHVLVIASEHAIGEWRARGQLCDPGLRERHGLSGCFAIPGAWTAGRKFADGISAAAQNGIVIGKDGGIQISLSSTEIKLGRNATKRAATAEDVLGELTSIATKMSGATAGGDAVLWTGGAYVAPLTASAIGAAKVKVE